MKNRKVVSMLALMLAAGLPASAGCAIAEETGERSAPEEGVSQEAEVDEMEALEEESFEQVLKSRRG